jgi:hypothetical protein
MRRLICCQATVDKHSSNTWINVYKRNWGIKLLRRVAMYLYSINQYERVQIYST